MEEVSAARKAFAYYLRTGRRVSPSAFEPAIELKFNPYHDPRNGRFTFAPGGPRIDPRTGRLRRTASAPSQRPRTELERRLDAAEGKIGARLPGRFDDGVFRPAEAPNLLHRVVRPPRRPAGIGHNSRGLHDALTLQRIFPGLLDAPAGALIPLADGIFDFTGPMNLAVDTLYQAERRGLIADIQKLRPDYRYDELLPAQSFEAKVRVIKALRARRAADQYLMIGNLHELQAETVRVLQEETDKAYAQAVRLQSRNKLPRSASERMALGRHVDRTTRGALRRWYDDLGISTKPGQQVRVNRRDYILDPVDAYIIPDIKVGNFGFDSTVENKGINTKQIRLFFNSIEGTDAVVIVRPRSEYPKGSYIIKRPGGR